MLPLLLILLFVFSACSAENNTETESSSEIPAEDIIIEKEPEPTEPIEPLFCFEGRQTELSEISKINPDVKSWIFILGLPDIDNGVCFSNEKTYPYSKKDVLGNDVSETYVTDGAFYNHFRNSFGATSAELSLNTVIFGCSDFGTTNNPLKESEIIEEHLYRDDPKGPLFSQLFNFMDPSFAEKTPYIYLTLPEEETIWQIFAVFYNDAETLNEVFSDFHDRHAGSIWYIEPSPTESEYALMLETIRNRSVYDYDVEVSSNDKILTLTTSTIDFGVKECDNYRFVVVAKLVEDAENLAVKNASFTINADAPVPGTYKEKFSEYAASWKPSAN